MELPDIDEKVKKELTQQRSQLNPVQIRKEILSLKRKLDKTAYKRRTASAKEIGAFKYEHNYVY